SARGTNICYMNDYAKISAATYGLILLLDVLEHVNDDRTLLRDITERNLALDGRIVITAPMFQELFASHDAFLGHHRRYSLRELVGLADACGLHIIASGYLFTSVLLVRALSTGIQTLLKRPLASSHGVGNWNHGAFITKVAASLLLLDARISLLLRGMSINLPGLTGWIVCAKQRS
ncbi:MAG TPA: hypothetical protein VIX18_11775, partial [Nitrospirota bacterium]